jgi:hypothetical protein
MARKEKQKGETARTARRNGPDLDEARFRTSVTLSTVPTMPNRIVMTV